ncbi:hypothetical protein LOTGIDRAFT_237772 [Lottia gigantea]|uniref:non-specific serine/threonine protein kinase n=1 Tax=Lottia gigantea TaxID=225164 RepID=V4AZT0_LOTGI|nr:hypothetical protein LOTGIDRAFT_237772 [Lottia gigantea]ESP03243.1 hypothetical protein LOTGIDRAFT_237772 [Lottia gigantea]
MESYNILESLGKGAQGSVYLAECKDEPGSKYVLKKIECHDESEANEAYREALELQKLHHPYICSYKDFYVTWDKSTSSMFLCIVMQYYLNSDLQTVIKSYQDKKDKIEESTVKKYLGEIIEALIFVHKKGVIHRDLKPSNIFLQDNQTLCLADFGVATVMADACTNTRNTLCEKSDIWAVGCILFELCTTFLYDENQVKEKLKEIKESPLVLEDVFEEIAECFSGDLIRLIREMLKHSHEKRKTTIELLENSYIKQCLELSDIYMIDKKRRQEESGSTVSALSQESQGLLSILEHIAKSIDHEVQVRDGLQQLIGLTDKDTGVLLDDRSKKLVAMAMKNNINDKDIQIAGCSVLNNLVLKAEGEDILFSSEIISVISFAMKQHINCEELQQKAVTLLMSMSANATASEVMGEVGCINNILSAVTTFPDNTDLVSTCCSVLWYLAVDENNLQICSNQQALKQVCKSLEKHISSPDVCESAAAAIISLSLDDAVLDYVNEIDCVGHLIRAISTHVRHPKVVKNSCMALTGLVESDEECAYRVLTSEDNEGHCGIPVIIKAYNQHKDNAEVVESMVNLIVQLANYDDVNAELRYLSVGPTVLSEVYKRFKPTRTSYLLGLSY